MQSAICNTEREYEYDAFISYSRRNEVFAARLHKDLERFRPPKSSSVPHRNLRVFRDRTDFTAGEYSQRLTNALKNSAKLIVICSPDARKSQYVNEEVRLFAQLRHAEDIIPVLYSGLPNNETNADDKELNAFPDALMEMVRMPLAISYLAYDSYRGKVDGVHYFDAWYSLLATLFDTSRTNIEQRDRLRKARTRRLAAGLAGAVVASLSVLLAIALISRNDAERARDSAKKAEAEAIRQKNIAQKNERESIKQTNIAIAQKNSVVRTLVRSLLSQSESRRLIDDQIGALILALRAYQEYLKAPKAYQTSRARMEVGITIALAIQKSINPFGLKEVNQAPRQRLEWNGASVAFNARHRLFAVANAGNGNIDLYSSTGVFKRSLSCPRCTLIDTAMDEIIGASQDTVYRINLISGTPFRLLTGATAISSVSVAPKGDLIYLADQYLGFISLRRTSKGHYSKQVFASRLPLVVAASPDGAIWASADFDGTIYVRSKSGKLIASIPTEAEVISSISISGDNRLIAVGSLGGSVYMITPEVQEGIGERDSFLSTRKAEYRVTEVTGHRHGVRAVRIGPSGTTSPSEYNIASLDDHGTLLLRRRHQYMITDGIQGNSDNVSQEMAPRFYPSNWLAFSQDGARLAALQEMPESDDRVLRIWTTEGTGLISRPSVRTHSLSSENGRREHARVKFSKSIFSFVSIHGPKVTKRFSAGHQINSAAMDRSTGLVATSGVREVKLWNSDGNLLAVLPRFNPDNSNFDAELLFRHPNRGLAIEGRDGRVLVWSFNPTVAMVAGCLWLRPFLESKQHQLSGPSLGCTKR